MTVGLLTFYHIHHYGALLQAAATQRTVERLGGACEIIDYFVNQDNRLFRLPTSPRTAAADIHTALHYPALHRRYQRFEQFSREHLKLTPVRYESLNHIREAKLSCDVILSGSDQIWNPLIFPNRRFDPVFFGVFSQARKIAYAPSFGIRRLPDGMEEELRGYLAAFSHLSAREPAGQSILRDVTGREAPVVLDPTLLLTPQDWAAMARNALPPRSTENRPGVAPGYILCYCISDPGVIAPYVRAVRRETGLPVVQLCGVRRAVIPGSVCVLDAGPAEFLDLFRNAAFVCTNSFHGTVFSLLFQKPFFTAVSPGERSDPESSRTYSLLQSLGLTDRLAGTGTTASMGDSIRWEDAGKRLEAARERSLAYLRAALQGDSGVRSDRGSASDAMPSPKHRGRDLPPLAAHERCTGCTACFSVCPRRAIAMEPDREGFLFPAVQSDLCVRCGCCTAVCPALHEREKPDTAGSAKPPEGSDPIPAGSAKPVEGPVRPLPRPLSYAAWNLDESVRRNSSSGGVFSVLAEEVLCAGGVVFGAAMDAQMRVVHTAVSRREDLWRLRGAKYVQSRLGDTFAQVRQALKNGQRVLFSGTPCQVDGLYRYLGQKPENLVTCDLVCHGVPSPGVWEAVREELRRRRTLQSCHKASGAVPCDSYGKIQSVRFREKISGWRSAHMTVSYEGLPADSRPLYETEYGHAFGRNLFLRRACHHCAYANWNRPGDFTLGDCWDLRPEELPDVQKWGVSLLLVNTEHGRALSDRVSLGRKPFPLERAVAGNPNLSAPTPRPADREAFFSAFALDPFPEVWDRFLKRPPLPVRAAGKLLSPKLRQKIKRLIAG